MTAENGDRHREAESTAQPPGLWSRLDTPVKVIGGVVAIAALLVPGFIAVFGNPWAANAQDIEAKKNPAAVAAHQITRCMERHGLRSPRMATMFRGKRYTFRRCDWPPVATSGTDGYSEVIDKVTFIPGRAAADPYDEVDAFRAPCDAISVTFVLDHMFSREFVTKRLQIGRLYHVGFARVRQRYVLRVKQLARIPFDVGEKVPLPSPSATEFYVLRSAHVGVFDAHCV